MISSKEHVRSPLSYGCVSYVFVTTVLITHAFKLSLTSIKLSAKVVASIECRSARERQK